MTTVANNGGNLCWGCKTFQEIVLKDGAERPFCADCVACFPASNFELVAAAWLMAGSSFQVGDKVSCTSGGVVYDGVGHVVEISVDPKNLASPVIPMFRVQMDEKAYPEMPDEMWYPEILLEKVDVNA